LEQVILRMRDEAGVAATDLYLEQVKKNKNLSESRSNTPLSRKLDD
jgi:hypothetical protein